MGCLTFETAIENRSLSAFCLCVIIGFSPFITLVGVSMFTLFFAVYFLKMRSLSILIGKYISVYQTIICFSFKNCQIILLCG